MDQDDPFPEVFLSYNQFYVCAGTTANRSTVPNDIKRRFRNKLHISANMGACLSRQAS